MEAAALLLLIAIQGTGGEPAAGAPDGALPRRVRAQALFAEGNPEDALREATAGLEFAPENLDLLDLASRSAERLGRKDEALAFSRLALGIAREGPERKPLAEELSRRIAGLDPLESKGAALVEECAALNFRLAEACAARSLPLNAIDLHLRSLGTPFDARARVALDRLYSSAKVAETLLEAGPDLPLRAPGRASPDRTAEEDMRHYTWADAWRIRGPRTLLVTNVGRESAEAVSGAMEQMVRHYETLLRRPARGDPPPLTLRVYSSEGEYEELETSRPAGAPGFYSPGENYVATHDPLWKAAPRPLLWRNLFREASRAFLPRGLEAAAPPWIVEGTAACFEGARLHPNGWVEADRIPEQRLPEAARALERGEPTLKEVVSLEAGGEQPAGFGDLAAVLVAFLLHYEDERSVRTYRPLHAEFLDAARSAAKSAPFDRFVSTFVKKARSPGVETFEDFVGRFETWVVDVRSMHAGPSAAADRFLERARKQRRDGKREVAIESCRSALRKRPDDPAPLLEMAEVEAEMRRKDAALLHLRRALESGGEEEAASRDTGGGGVLEERLARVGALDKPLADGLRELRAARRDRAIEVARAYAGAGFPREALRVLDGVRGAIGPDGGLAALRKEIARSSGVDSRRWRCLRLGPGLDSWEWGERQEAAPDGILFKTERPTHVFYRHAIPDPYRFEVTLVPFELPGESGARLLFGVHGEGGLLSLSLAADGRVTAQRFGEAGPKAIRSFPTLPWDRKRPLRLAVDVSEAGAEFFVDDRSIGRIPLSPSERTGRVGLSFGPGKAEFRHVRARW